MRESLRQIGARVVVELRDAFELFLLPGLAIVLPWPACYRLFRRSSRSPWLYRQQTEAALAAAHAAGFAEDAERFTHGYRLTQLVDHADLYLSRFRGDRWLRRYVSLQAAPLPRGRGFLLVGFHWGVGLWLLRYLRSHGVQASLLSRAVDRGSFAGRTVRYWYGRARMAEVERIGRSPVIYVGNSVQRMAQVLAGGTTVVALIDVPPGRPGRGLPVRFLDKRARFPRGLTRLASEEGVPLFTFTVALEHGSGRRSLRIEGPLPAASESALMERIGEVFDQALRADAPAWHFWALLDGFLEADKRA